MFLQDPSLLEVLQSSAASPHDIFLVNFGRWHFNNCKGIQADTYTQSLTELGVFYEVHDAAASQMSVSVIQGISMFKASWQSSAAGSSSRSFLAALRPAAAVAVMLLLPLLSCCCSSSSSYLAALCRCCCCGGGSLAALQPAAAAAAAAAVAAAVATAILQATKVSFPNLLFKTSNHDHTPCATDNRRVVIPPTRKPQLITSTSSSAGNSSSSTTSSSSSSDSLRSFSELELMRENFSPSCPAAGKGGEPLQLLTVILHVTVIEVHVTIIIVHVTVTVIVHVGWQM
jgi:hypothetical protein